MRTPILAVITASLLLASHARAEETAQPFPVDIGDVVYKGVVGKALDAVPMDSEGRVALQRTSAVVSGTLTGRSLAAWVGLSHPILMIAGVVWGIYSASNIRQAETKAPPEAERVSPPEPADSGAAQVAHLAHPWADVATEVAR